MLWRAPRTATGPSTAIARRGGFGRLSARLLLVLQALLWCGGPSIEAMSASDAMRTGSHIEALGGAACPPIHSHLDCQICRTFSSGAVTAHAQDLLLVASRVTGAVDAPAGGATGDGRFGPLGSRAPPRAPSPGRPIA